MIFDAPVQVMVVVDVFDARIVTAGAMSMVNLMSQRSEFTSAFTNGTFGALKSSRRPKVGCG